MEKISRWRALLPLAVSAILLLLPCTGWAAGKSGNFAAFDRDRDGRVALSEFLASGSERFQRFDLDRDGSLSPLDLEKAGGFSVLLISSQTRQKFLDRYQAMDTNGDGEVESSEFLSFRRERFEAMDIDGDGWVSEPEYQSFRSARKGAGPSDLRQ